MIRSQISRLEVFSGSPENCSMARRPAPCVRERFEVIKTNYMPRDFTFEHLAKTPDRFLWGDLAGPIHPLFGIEQFSNVDVGRTEAVSYLDHPMSTDFYALLKPALRLATIFFEDAKPYMMAVLFAPRTEIDFDDEVEEELDLTFTAQIQSQHHQRYEKTLVEIAANLRIGWSSDQKADVAISHTMVTQHSSIFHTSPIYRAGSSTGSAFCIEYWVHCVIHAGTRSR